MKKIGIAVMLLLGCLLLVWVGLMVYFPGKALSRFISAHVARRAPQVRLQLAPAELQWTRLYFPQADVALNQPGGAIPLFALKDLAIPLPWRLFRGLPLEATLGASGRIDLFFPWAGSPVRLVAADLQLNDIPGLRGLLPGPAKGLISLTGDLEPQRTRQGELRMGIPGGNLAVTARALTLGPFTVMGQRLPPAQVESVDVRLKGGNVIQVEQFSFKGDIQGEIKGSITPNLAQPQKTNMRLQIAAAFRQDWMRQLGILQTLMGPYLDNGRLTVSLTGTVERPNLRVNSPGAAPISRPSGTSEAQPSRQNVSRSR